MSSVVHAGVVNGTAHTPPLRRIGVLESLARSALIARLSALRYGRIALVEGQQTTVVGSQGPMVTVVIHDPAVWREVATGGTVGAGGAFSTGLWSCDDAVQLVRIFIRNRDILDGMEQGTARLFAPLLRLWHWANRNTTSGSRKNIAAHYDLGNDFFSLWLDPSMLYSSAVFEDQHMSLYQAQIAKCERLCKLLDLHFDDHLLEIGTGWGGFAIHAAQTYGCRVTTTTISKAQYDLARERVRAAGLESRIQVLLQDYRELTGTYDKLVSIEMIEAVGHRFYDNYFAACCRLLKPDGIFAMQAITIAEQQYHTALKEVDFIQRYVFPGSCIPSLSALTASCGRASDFNLVACHDITPHYARTLQTWRANFHQQLEQIRQLGYDERLIRLWDFYLAYCEGGFAERAIGTVHLLFARQEWRTPLQQRMDRAS